MSEFVLSNKIITAPLAGITDKPFRDLFSEFKPALLYSEMITAEGIIRNNIKTMKMLDDACVQAYTDVPVTVQIFGSHPEQFKNAIEIIQSKYRPFSIDLNMGCPVKKIIKNGAGAALMTNPHLIARILETVAKISAVKITVKIRLGWNDKNINYLQIAEIAEKNNVSAVALHCRTAAQMYSGKSDWSHMKILKSRCSLPVIGNGDILTFADYLEKKDLCDYIMIGRGILYNPFLIKQILTENKFAYSLNDLKTLMLKHLDLLTVYYGENTGVRHFRKHFAWYVKSLAHAKKLRESGFRAVKTADFKNIIAVL